MENDNKENKEIAVSSDNKMLIPGAIILAGLIIAGAVVYSQLPRNPLGPNPTPPAPPSVAAGDILKIREGDFVLGNPSSKVVIIEYGDFQCPFCGKFEKEVAPQIKEQYVKTGKVAFLYRDFAFLGEESFRSSEAARCAGDQGKYWEYHDKLFSGQKGENQGAFADANLKKFARDLGLDGAKFDLCFTSGKHRAAVETATQDGRTAGVNGTPATFVNGKLVSGAVPFATFKQMIEEELKK